MSDGSDRGRLPWMGPGMTYHEFRHQMKNPYFKAVFDKACQLEALIGEALRRLDAGETAEARMLLSTAYAEHNPPHSGREPQEISAALQEGQG